MGAGLVASGMTFFPLQLGNLDWEFGTFGEFGATSSLPLMGTAMVAAAALRRDARWAVLVSTVLLVIFSLVSALAVFILLTDLPIVWNATAPSGNSISSQNVSVRIAFVKSVGISLLSVLALTLAAGYQVRNLLSRERSRHA